MSQLPPVIVLGVDTPIGLTVIRELGSHGVHVHGIGRTGDAIGRSSRWIGSFSVRPRGVTLEQWLPELIRETGAKALFAISEDDLVALSKLPVVVEGCLMLTPRQTQLELVLDKSKTLAAAEGVGISAPSSWQPILSNNFAECARTLAYPVVIKWADPPAVVGILAKNGIPLDKVAYADDADSLLALLSRYDGLAAWPLVQEFCSGAGLGQMLHMANGKATLRFQHLRLHEWPPQGGVSTLCRSLPLDQHRAQMEMSEALLASIGWEGPAMVEYRYDADTGRYALMEINGRFWGSLPLARHCGATFTWEQYRIAVLGENGPAVISVRQRTARFMIPETRRLLRVLFTLRGDNRGQYVATPLRDLISYIGGFFDPKMRYYVFCINDPGPMFRDLFGVIRRILNRGKPRQGL